MTKKVLTGRFVIATTAALFLTHFLLWMIASNVMGRSLTEILSNWDSGWYNAIIQSGYSGQNWAFFPLYPLLVRAVGVILPGAIPAQVLGTVLSTLLFGGFVGVLLWLSVERDSTNNLLVPSTRLAWLVFLLSPASFIFHSHHTESLFQLLSYGAFALAFARRPNLAAVFAGLCALTRIQGLAVAVTIGFVAAYQQPAGWRRWRRFIVSGAISFWFFDAFLTYQHAQTGSAFTFLEVQSKWAHPDQTKLITWLKGLVGANPWQPHTPATLLHHLFFFVLIYSSFLLRKRWPAHALYVGLSLAMIVPEAQLVDVFRFGAVMFPALFVLGQNLEKYKPIVQRSVLTLMLALNLIVAYMYGISHWAY